MKLALDIIRIDGGTQPRVSIDTGYVSELAEVIDAIKAPIVVFHDGKDHWMADGFHRYHAARQAQKKTLLALVKKGTRRDAILYSVGANAEHGLRRTNADKRCAVEMLLADGEWGKRSSNWISEKCCVSWDLVEEIRKSNSGSGVARVAKDGRKGWAGVSDKPEEHEEKTPLFTPPTAAPPEPEQPPAEEPIDTQTDQAVTEDETGRTITDLAVASIFKRRRELEDLGRQASDIKSVLTRGVEGKDELYSEFNLSQVQADCNNIRNAVRFAKPHAVCRWCNGARSKPCKACGGRGWVGEAKFKATPEEMK